YVSLFCFSPFFFLYPHTATTEISTLSLHDALPICADPGLLLPRLPDPAPHRRGRSPRGRRLREGERRRLVRAPGLRAAPARRALDRKSTRLNSSHDQISYAVFCLKKKTKKRNILVR